MEFWSNGVLVRPVVATEYHANRLIQNPQNALTTSGPTPLPTPGEVGEERTGMRVEALAKEWRGGSSGQLLK